MSDRNEPDNAFDSSLAYFHYLESGRSNILRAMKNAFLWLSENELGSPKRVLEIGSGNGFLRRNIPNFDEWVELEIVVEHLKDSRKRDSNGIFITGDSRRLPFADEYFDTVIGFNSFDQYGEDLDSVVEEARRVLKTRGSFFHIIDQPQAEGPAIVELKSKGLDYIEIMRPLRNPNSNGVYCISSLFYGTPEQVAEINRLLGEVKTMQEKSLAEMIETVSKGEGKLIRVDGEQGGDSTDEIIRMAKSGELICFQETHPNKKLESDIPPEILELIKKTLKKDDGYRLFADALLKSLKKCYESPEEKYVIGLYNGFMTNQQIELVGKNPGVLGMNDLAKIDGGLAPPLMHNGIIQPEIYNSALCNFPKWVKRYIRPMVSERAGLRYIKAIK